MKFTLKNRPRTDGTFKIFDKLNEFDAWFEGFEEELREMKKAWEGIEDNQPDLNIIREILGDDHRRKSKENEDAAKVDGNKR